MEVQAPEVDPGTSLPVSPRMSRNRLRVRWGCCLEIMGFLIGLRLSLGDCFFD